MRRYTRNSHGILFCSLLLVGVSWRFPELGVPATFLGSGVVIEVSPGNGVWQSISTDSTTLAPEKETSSDTVAKVTVSPTPQYQRDKKLAPRATIVVQLSGEMANNLHHIAHGLGLQLLAKEEFDIDCNIIVRHFEGANNRAPKPKWKSARDNIQRCFPNLSHWKFNEGNTKDFLQKQKLQQTWLGGRVDHLFGLINSGNISKVQQGVEFFSNNILIDPDRPWTEEDSPIRLPYLYSETLDAFPMIDRYYDQIRDLMQFNDSLCCIQVPGADDSVFHFRNYESEMPERRAYDMGFAELSPSKVAKEVFGTLTSGNRVQITTRIFNQKARNYAEALQQRGINASVVTDQSAVQDFCFLKLARKEVVGSARSTFVMWAALLGDAHDIRLYHVHNHGLIFRHPDFWERFTYNFTHPRLRDRLRFELYHADDERR